VSALRIKDAWITPKEPPPTIAYHREVPAWELLLPVVEEITDADYMANHVYWQIIGGAGNA
jgi:hypothetical protein